MADEPKNDHQVTTPDGKLNLDPAKQANAKVYDFSAEDQQFLQPRQILINQKKLEVADIDYSMQNYIMEKVLPRLSIDPTKNMIQFNISTNKLTVIAKPPEILVPKKEIIVPGKK